MRLVPDAPQGAGVAVGSTTVPGVAQAPAAAPASTPATTPAPTPAPAPGALRLVPDAPGWLDQAKSAGDWALSNVVEPGGKFVGRQAIRYATAFPSLAAAGVNAMADPLERARTAVRSSLGLSDDQPQPLLDAGGQPLPTGRLPIPSEAAIGATGLTMDPDASTAMRAADFLTPFLMGRGGWSRIGEAQGGVNKVAQGLGYLTGGGIDAGLSYLGSNAGEYLGGNTGGFVGSLLGGGVRTVGQRLVGAGGKAVLNPNVQATDKAGNPITDTAGNPVMVNPGGVVYDATRSAQGPSAMPTFGMVTGDTGKRWEKAVESVPIVGRGVTAARNAAEAGINRSIAAGQGEVGDRAPSFGPVDKDVTAGRITSAAQNVNANLQSSLSADQQALEDAIGRETGASVSPLVATLTNLSTGKTTSAPASRTLEPRIDDLYTSINRQNPPDAAGSQPYPATAAYGALKELREDLRSRTDRAQPLEGRYLEGAENAYTDAMRAAAEDKGVGGLFDAANQRYAEFKNVTQPWLTSQGGELTKQGRFENVPNPRHVAAQAEGITGANPQHLLDIEANLGTPVARETLADVLSRRGQTSGRPEPDKWATDWEGVNQTTKDFIARTAPQATPYLENAATAGKAFNIAPERPGASKAAGWLASLAAAASKAPRTIAALGAATETPSVIRAMAGKTDIPALVAQYALRQGASR